MKSIIPAPLKIGDTIGVMSPSSYIEEADLNTAVKIIEARGYKINIHPQTLAHHNQSAGNNAEKLAAFHDLVKNPDIDAIIFAMGGNRALHWVDQIDFDLVRDNPKIMMGFSDITVLLNIIHAKTGLVTYHGPNLRWFKVHADNVKDTEKCFEMLSSLSSPLNGHDEVFYKHPIIGGNASIIQCLINDINFQDKILILEDANIETSHLDRLFCNLKRQGIFEQINGLILGHFINLLDTGRPYGFTLDDIIAEHVPSDLPIIRDAPIGHGDRLITLPIGLNLSQ